MALADAMSASPSPSKSAVTSARGSSPTVSGDVVKVTAAWAEAASTAAARAAARNDVKRRMSGGTPTGADLFPSDYVSPMRLLAGIVLSLLLAPVTTAGASPITENPADKEGVQPFIGAPWT